MMLMSLLLVLSLERLIEGEEGSKKVSSTALYFYLLLPAVVLGAFEYWVLGAFLTFIEQSIILFICIGSFGQHLTWLNYQHYAAVMLWFIAFGAPGALFYSLSRSTTEALCDANHPSKSAAGRLMFALDYIPVRVTAFGMLMMGHFSRALPEWIKYALQFDVPAYDVLTQISSKAEILTPDEQQLQAENAAMEPKVLVKLAKRNVIFLLVITSALTALCPYYCILPSSSDQFAVTDFS